MEQATFSYLSESCFLQYATNAAPAFLGRSPSGASAREDRVIIDTGKDTAHASKRGKNPDNLRPSGQEQKPHMAPKPDQTGTLGSALLEAMKRQN